VEIVDFYEDDDERKIAVCSRCLKFGIESVLKNRIYPDNQIPVDHENWLQCYNCGLIVPIYELQKESQIKDVVETIDNPFDIGTSFLGIDKRTSVGGKNARKKKERQKELDDIKDDEVKRELAKGNTLLSYTEYQPQ
jgi:hypothetical protein